MERESRRFHTQVLHLTQSKEFAVNDRDGDKNEEKACSPDQCSWLHISQREEVNAAGFNCFDSGIYCRQEVSGRGFVRSVVGNLVSTVLLEL